MFGATQWHELTDSKLAVDSFTREDDQYALPAALEILAARLKDHGKFLILDIDRNYAPHDERVSRLYQKNLYNGRKDVGYGSKEVIAALKKLGFEDIAVIKDL